ncbi:hypothetical protein B0G57_102241 [Trinickia symbiotica]|nr:hypothetical protein B0G57_102241 [Trinickia symbiotica]
MGTTSLVFLMSAYDIDPGTFTPRVKEMTDFNMWTWSARVFPGVVKVREGLGRNDYRDPGWFKHPKGTVAFNYTGELPDS